jgi:hypothetical protein
MSLQLDIARSHLETLIERVTGMPKAVADDQGDYLIKTDYASFLARVDGTDKPIIRMYSVIVKDVPKSSELLDAINDINTQLAFLRAMWVDEYVLIETETLAMTTAPDDFLEMSMRILQASDFFGPAISKQFGGTPSFQNSRTDQTPTHEPERPGYL